MTEDAARLQDELELYQDYGNFAVDNLFWSLTFLNAVLFQTPNASEVKEKLLAQKRPYEGLITAYYPGPEGQRQVGLLDENNRLFIIYAQRCRHRDPAGRRIRPAQMGGKRRPDGPPPVPNEPPLETAGMERHDFPPDPADHLHRPATCQGQYDAFVNTAPLCKNVAIDMAAYMASGIAKRFLV